MEQWVSLLRSNFPHLDRSSQEWIFKEYRTLVYRDIYFLFRNHELAEDVVQESFIKVMIKAPKLNDASNLKAWIRTVARNTAYDLFKKNKKYRHMADNEVEMELAAASETPDIAEIVENRIRDEMLHEALNQLSHKYRLVLYYFYILNMSYKEIATEQHVSEQAVAQLLARSRKKLLDYFSRRWVDQDEE
jgi:RNA polymerase sigma-70 factor (ECF subfamily)